MKTFCLTLGLLMLIFYCCNSIPTAMEYTAPGNCCFKFSSAKAPIKLVTNITKTHKSCLKKGFIVTTVKRQICYDSTFAWALKIYDLFNDIEGSSVQ